MDKALPYQAAADALLILHTLFIAFVVLGQCLIIIGFFRDWQWIRRIWLRVAHLLAIGIVVLQAWLGVLCPLTVWESALRVKAGGPGYQESFIQHWLHRIIFYQAEPWVFTLCYTLFGLLVLATWVLAPPASRRKSGRP